MGVSLFYWNFGCIAENKFLIPKVSEVYNNPPLFDFL